MKNPFLKIFRREKDSRPIDPRLPGGSVEWPYSPSAGADPMSISAVYRCVRLISDSVAMLPIEIKRRKRSGMWEELNDTRVTWPLTCSPNRHQSSFDFWRQAIQQYLCWGNAVITPFRDDSGYAVEYKLCAPATVTYDLNNDIYSVNDEINGIYGNFRPQQVIHLRNTSGTGRWGVSVIENARMCIDISASGDKETRDRFKNGGNVRGFFSNPSASTVAGYQQYSDQAIKKVTENRDKYFREGGRMSFLPGGLQFKELMMNSADMQFLESRKFAVREICRFFGVSPSLIGDDSSGNYKSAEMASIDFLCRTLNPILVQIEQELRNKLFPFDRNTKIEFDRSALTMCDLETRTRIQASRLGAGLDTVNEARQAEGRGPVEDGDKALVSANLKPLSVLVSETSNPQNENDEKDNQRIP